jgi:hypothetical protein
MLRNLMSFCLDFEPHLHWTKKPIFALIEFRFFKKKASIQNQLINSSLKRQFHVKKNKEHTYIAIS